MLAQAEARGIATFLEHSRLQDLSYSERFDAALTIDGMENISPEDWPGVIGNLRRAVHPGSPLYLTVEDVGQAHIEEAFRSQRSQGLPAVRGEVTGGDVAGYHYYPGRDQAAAWFAAEGLRIADEGFTQHDGWGYFHFLLRRP
jgi:hypothetical protein